MNMILKKSSIILVATLLQACGSSLDDTWNNVNGNTSPTVNTTINTNVAVGVETTLTATATDPDGDILQYLWSITGLPTGSTATLTNADQPVSTFTPDLEGSYTTQLVVDDGTSKVTRTATIQAVLGNIEPTASIAPPPAAVLNSLVQLDGTPSTDPNNDTLSHRWKFLSRPTDSQAAFTNTNAAQPSFTVDVSGDYRVQLIVNDGELDSTPATATVTASGGNGNTSPSVNTAINTRATVGVQTSLTATATDPDGDTLQYLWSITGLPTGSTAILANADQPVSTFTPDLEGSYTVQVMVSDGTNEVTRTATIQAAEAAGVGASVVGVTIESTSGTEQSTVPVTFGQVFRPGEIPKNTLLSVRLAGGTQELIPSQIDKKATHADGSLRHAVVTARVPTLTSNNPQDIEIVVVDSEPTVPSVQLSDFLATNFDGVVSLTVAGKAYTVSIADLLQNETQSAQPKTWLSGPEVTEWIVSAPLKATNDGTEHPHLTARFNVRAYANFDSVRIDVIIENNWSYVPNPQNFVYNVSISLCGNEVYTKTDLTHYHHARWRKTFWCGDQPQVHINHDIDYLISTGAVPNYDQTLVVPESDLTKMGNDWIADISQPMAIGLVQAYMPGTGARPDIGPLPRWVTRYLLSQDVRAKTAMLGTADLAGSWSIHYRDRAKNQPISIGDYPYVSILGRMNSTLNLNTGNYEALPDCGGDCTSPYTPDSAHQPSLSYVPYLVTGDYYHLEELLFWANYNIMRAHPSSREQQKGLVKWEQVRGQAWSLRTLGHAAYISPDNHPLKQYFIDKIDNNIAYYDAQYTNNSSAPTLGFIINGYAIKNESGQGKISPWNDDTLTIVVQGLTDMGFSNAVPFRDWKVKFVYGRFSNDPTFCQTNAAAYRYVVQNTYQGRDSSVINTWRELHNSSFPSDTNNCPTEYDKGLPRSAESYLAISRGALAAAVAADYSNANTFIGAVNTALDNSNANFDSTPQWAIVPRN